ncbi:MAG: gliding motility-associated C-terminal domain-containing protein [Bacteroidetes bacterium]|nr:gliding motility-associated C-terminal domain-containing protein [Bacteroidota bacterium]
MRIFILLILSCSLFWPYAQGQSNPTNTTPGDGSLDFRSITRQSAEIKSPFALRDHQRGGVTIPISTLKNPRVLSNFIQQQIKISTSNGQPVMHKNSALGNPPLCKDTSFDKLIGLTNSVLYINSLTHTKDDGVLIVGEIYDSTVLNGNGFVNGLIVKTDNNGNVLWNKIFKYGKNIPIYELLFNTVVELQNGDIMIAGSTDTTNSGFMTAMLLYRLDAQGNVIWYKNYKSLISVSSQWVPVDIRTITEGQNGDLILCGTTLNNSSETSETVIRMDNAGNIIWDTNFGNYGFGVKLGANGLGAYYLNGKIVLVGISQGDEISYAEAINFVTLDYTTGNTLSKKFFTFNYSNFSDLFAKRFTPYSAYCTLTTSGHFIVYGGTLSDFMQSTNPVDHFAVVDFDASQNLTTAYTLSSSISSASYADRIFFDKSGNGVFMVVNYLSSYSANTFIGTLRNHQLSKERNIPYNNANFGNNSSFGDNFKFAFFNDGGYLFGQGYFDFNPPAGNYIEFRKMHDADTSSPCLGFDSLFIKKLPLLVKEEPAYTELDDAVQNKVYEAPYDLIPANDLASSSKNPCKQQNYCDTLKIHGPTVFCSTTQPQIFTTFKNISCGAIVQWTIDTSVINNATIINDTTISISFKNMTWQGKIYASIPAAHCTLSLSDSSVLHISNAPQPVDLGPDTILCSGNTILLHAGSNFSSYKWQDASTSSDFLVVKSGKYYVDVIDYCGNKYSDTVLVTDSKFALSLGPDTTKCNDDIILLKATPGFIKYRWTPSNYDIQSDSLLGTAYITPVVDTSYIVTAEKWTGCYVRDTILVHVLHSPTINLGKDTSICDGENITLDAGAGFNNYEWNTGASSEKIQVSQTGMYSVKASFANGCFSYDTMQVLQVFPLPNFSLSATADTILCDNETLSYHFNLPAASYKWSDGNETGIENIHSPGDYWLGVTQNGCTKYDSVHVKLNLSPSVDLGNDTSLCEGSVKQLDATVSNANYLWQDGSTSPIYTVTKSGTYFIRVNLSGCVASDTINVSYLSKPNFTLGKDTFLCEGQQLLLQPVINSQVNYTWQDGSKDSYYVVRNPGLYALNVENLCGYSADSIYVEQGVCKLLMPDAFTPNNDGKNDVFRVKYPFDVKKFNLQIFNRWGQKVFETNNISQGWNGTFAGLDQPVGGYVWFISLLDNSNTKQSASGTVILIR